MKGICRAVLLGVGCGLPLGCADPPLEEVCIVIVVEDDESGVPDSYTVVEFPDKTRRVRYKTWGKSGDVFRARKGQADCWGP